MAVLQLTLVRWKQGTGTKFLVAQGLAYTFVCSRSVLKLLWMCVLFGEGWQVVWKLEWGVGAALADRPLSGRCCELLAQRVTRAHSAGCTETRSSTPAKCLMCRSSTVTDVGTVLPHPPYSFALVPSVESVE